MLSARFSPILDEGSETQKRQEIKQYFINTWEDYESLFSCLCSDEAYYQRPESLRHPLIFYFGHTAVFFINKLRVSKIIDQRVDDRIESSLAIGVDEMSWDDLNDQHYDWPSVNDVRVYRDKVKQIVIDLIDQLPLNIPIQWEDPMWIILMGIEHERIHLETSSVLFRQLKPEHLTLQDKWRSYPARNKNQAPANNLIKVQGGQADLGHQLPAHSYAWDLELGQHQEKLENFRVSQYLVSNQEFFEFVEDDGYSEQKWWTDEGWQWKQFKNAEHPCFWVKTTKGSYLYRTMLELIDMPWNWPVDVNYLEAKAFCAWKSACTGKSIRLPSEAEWAILQQRYVQGDHSDQNQSEANLNLAKFTSSCPVDMFKHGELYDLIGNVWQWTETTLDAFEGFKPHPAYDDFSVPTFDGQHNVIKGGSWISTGNEAGKNARFAFRRHFFQHAGFRYVESENNVTQQSNTYETDELIAQYLEFHYGDEYFGVTNFPVNCIHTLIPHVDKAHRGRALDIGCAVGRSSFELARYFDHVDAVDFSTRFINKALALREHGKVRYVMTLEGELTEVKEVLLEDLGVSAYVNKIHFSQGDACNLRDIYHGYDLIFAGNLIDRLYDPKQFLADIRARLNPGGYLVITSPYTWLEEFTEKQNWLGGLKVNGENVTTLDALHQQLEPEFELCGHPVDVPFVIRETARKYQHTIAQLSIWKYKG
ncbi:MAG: 5-histidylcysteine sulfoxide synthase [bacterium]